MKHFILLSASAMFLLARAGPIAEEPSLAEVIRSLKMDEIRGSRSLGRDGVIHRFNGAHDTVLDYVQLSTRHIEEYTKRFPVEAREMWDGVDGRNVMSNAQLWAVPDDIV